VEGVAGLVDDRLQQLVPSPRGRGQPGDAVENAVLENIRIVTADLPKQSPVLAQRIETGALKVIGLRYDLDSGIVTAVNVPAPIAKSAR